MKWRPIIGYANTAALLFLAALCVAGSFCDAARARDFFHHPAVVLLWMALSVAFAAALLYDGVLARRPGRLASHAGCLLIILGSMWNSDEAHGIAARLLGSDKASGGFVILFEGQSTDKVYSDGFQAVVAKLGFELKLDEFSIDYYPHDAGVPESQWVIRSYTSKLAILRDGKELFRRDVQVNHPLRFGGYQFFQHSWGANEHHGVYTILQVVSDQGVLIVYGGFVLLALGVAWLCWTGPIRRRGGEGMR
jgi:hypothetical protein